jgi:hypothetical protein
VDSDFAFVLTLGLSALVNTAIIFAALRWLGAPAIRE